MINVKFFITFLIILTFVNAGTRIDWHNVKSFHIVPNSYIRTAQSIPSSSSSSFFTDDTDDDFFSDDETNSRISSISSSSSSLTRFLNYDFNNDGTQNFPFTYEQVHHRRHGAMKRIFGGNVALHSTIPYQVGLLLKTKRGLNWCGGSLISHDYVVTAAHCLDTAVKALVFLGSYEIKNQNEAGAKRIEVFNSHFIVHPGWNARRLMNDIALLKFPKSVEFTDSIQPIKLPTKKFIAESFAGRYATASGWGRFSIASPTISYQLRYVQLPILSQASCLRSYPFLLQPSNICTSGKNGKSTCTGDSGGPLVVDGEGTKILIGVTSFGSIFGCEKGYPGVYTRVTSYLNWIQDITGVGYSVPQNDNDDKDDGKFHPIKTKTYSSSSQFDESDDELHDRFDKFNIDEQFQRRKRKR